MITKDYRPERLHSDLSRFRNGNPFHIYRFSLQMRQYVISGGEKRPRRLRIGIPICFSECSRAQISLPYIQIRQHIILGISESLHSDLSRFRKGYPLFIIISLNPPATLCILLNIFCAYIYTIFVVYRW